MREHMGLFRGKRIDNGEWVEGYLEYWRGITGLHCYISVWGRSMHAVDPNTVGECTGLKDKNGKLIFEGDIVTFETTVYLFKPCVIKWSFTKMRFIAKGREASYPMDIDFKYEIIGNIHDNGELLKGGEDA